MVVTFVVLSRMTVFIVVYLDAIADVVIVFVVVVVVVIVVVVVDCDLIILFFFIH